MKRKKPEWMGSSVDEFIADEMKSPAFRVAFAEARAHRIKRAIAESIREARRQRHLSQITLARKAGTTQAVISRIENAKVNYLPGVEVLARIALALGANLEIAFVPRKPRTA